MLMIERIRPLESLGRRKDSPQRGTSMLPCKPQCAIRLAAAFLSPCVLLFLLAGLTLAQSPEKEKKGKKPDAPLFAKLRIEVKAGDENKAVGNASVYIRYDEPHGVFHRKKEIELNFKTNQDGSVKVPEVPRGKVLVQVVAPGWHTFGRWYVVEKDEEIIEIKLEKPPQWY